MHMHVRCENRIIVYMHDVKFVYVFSDSLYSAIGILYVYEYNTKTHPEYDAL